MRSDKSKHPLTVLQARLRSFLDTSKERMTITELASLVGQEGTVNLGAFNVRVKVLDVKESYGRVRYQVAPVAGSGEMWTERLTLG